MYTPLLKLVMWAWNISFEIFHFWQFFLKYFNDQKKHVFFKVLDAHKLTQCLELDQFVLFQWHGAVPKRWSVLQSDINFIIADVTLLDKDDNNDDDNDNDKDGDNVDDEGHENYDDSDDASDDDDSDSYDDSDNDDVDDDNKDDDMDDDE